MTSRRPTTANAESLRKQQLARIHMAKSQLRMDDDTYRCLLRRVTGQDSSAKMSTDQRNAVIAELTRLGFKDRPRKDGKRVFKGEPKNSDRDAVMSKIRALLTDSGREWAYAHAMAKHMFKSDRLEWLKPDQLRKLMVALQVDANRRKKDSK
jgi:phage gp16-like protein